MGAYLAVLCFHQFYFQSLIIFIAVLREVFFHYLTDAVLQLMADMIVFTILVITDVIEGVISVLTQFQLAKLMSWRMIDDRLILWFHQQTVSATQSYLSCFLVLYAEYAWIGVKGIISSSSYIEAGILVVTYGQAWQQYSNIDG